MFQLLLKSITDDTYAQSAAVLLQAANKHGIAQPQICWCLYITASLI